MVRRLLARFGFAAIGVLYVSIGILTAQVAFFGARGQTIGVPEALDFLRRLPHGIWILVGLAVGLGGFAVLKFAQARSRRRRFLERVGHALAGLGYAALCWGALRLLLSSMLQTRDGARGEEVFWLFSHPWGRAALVTAGALVVGTGFFEIYQGWSGRLKEKFARRKLPAAAARFATRSARFGLAARGFVLLMIGSFWIRSGQDLDPDEVRGMGEALGTLSLSPFGRAAMGVVALGLVGYGLYMWVLAVFNRSA
ncbi:MAG TPA: DUF1206 domain-containing protein [Thermoanaerobaculia bacterium]|nr:DUF1206 domain-containing protein [Thermoanaerobaculia bacterium]